MISKEHSESKRWKASDKMLVLFEKGLDGEAGKMSMQSISHQHKILMQMCHQIAMKNITQLYTTILKDLK